MARLAGRFPGVTFGLHLHNTRSMGLANLLAGLEAGITRFDSSVAGLGGCPYAPGATGNVAACAVRGEDLLLDLNQGDGCLWDAAGPAGHQSAGATGGDEHG